MTQELTQNRTVDGTRVLAEQASWHRLALAAILVVSAFLNLWDLSGEAYSNNYYSAAVKSMLTSPYNVFFVSYDAGFVSVDKPPLGLWIQAASAYAYGFHGWALLLPQAVAGVLSIAIVYHLVRRTFGPVAGLLAALVLAIMPIVVVTSRNNTADMLVILTVLVAAWSGGSMWRTWIAEYSPGPTNTWEAIPDEGARPLRALLPDRGPRSLRTKGGV